MEPLSPRELRARLAAGEDLLLIDVREAQERELCSIEGSLHIPLGELARRQAELDPGRPIVCICHHGIRSAHAAAALERFGFSRLFNLSGGVERWAVDVDPGMARY